MLKTLKTSNVGPAPSFELEFGKRLNIITGDNGLGKSFLLDIAWWALTRNWPGDINKRLTSGMMATPSEKSEEAVIEFSADAKQTPYSHKSVFRQDVQTWPLRQGRPGVSGLVLYAQADGSFAVWDPARNYWKDTDPDRPIAYIFSAKEVWNGLGDKESPLCNGLINDWAGWQKENGLPYKRLCSVLKALSPSDREMITPGPLTRISVDDSRDIPTLQMPYGQSVPVLYASAGMRRIIALAYLLVWCWQEHNAASEIRGTETTSQIIFLIDEIEAHLHPKWQRRIIDALLDVMNSFTSNASVQLIAATHSPLVLSSLEPTFDNERDAWFDLDLVTNGGDPRVELTKRLFEKHGDVSNWLTSEAFDLQSARSEQAEQVLEEAAIALSDETFGKDRALELDRQLSELLSELDPFWLRWRYVAEKKGWLT